MKLHRMLWPRWIMLLALCASCVSVSLILAQTTTVPEAAPAETDPMDMVSVEWGREMLQGGMTMVALGLLSVALLAFSVERFLVLRREKFVPKGLAAEVRPLFVKKQFQEIVQRCETRSSTLGRCIAYLVEHRQGDPALVGQAAGDLAARELADQEVRHVPFAVIAALAPLLGLLGTMIGMIEAFKLVEVFGDEGGASMLAGSISKALITTAAGLILSIPAIGLYHFFRYRMHRVAQTLEAQLEDLFSTWFIKHPSTTAPGDAPTLSTSSRSAVTDSASVRRAKPQATPATPTGRAKETPAITKP